MRELLLKALGVESEEQYVDDKAKHLIDSLVPVIEQIVDDEVWNRTIGDE